MSGPPAQPVIYEVNTRVWLGEVRQRVGRAVDLAGVPGEAWDELALSGVDAVWLMGVWERSPEGRRIALADPALRDSFRQALPDVRDEDIVGSPYCIRSYVVDDHLGGPAALAAARAELACRGLGLVLDYVPNHVAPDSPWAVSHPDYFVRGSLEDLHRDPAAFCQVGDNIFARGRDPYFAPWPDVIQLNAFSTTLREATADVLVMIGDQCDGVRCDMAMLLMNDVFAKTWKDLAGPPPASEFWPAVLTQVRTRHPNMRFVAEAYWDLEWSLQQQGFDHCYDKRLYDRLLQGSPDAVRLHLLAGLDYQRRLVRFLENHDEPRAAGVMAPAKERAAATLLATLPGATLWHEGQFDGRRIRLPVFLARRPVEPLDAELREFHRRLLEAVHASRMRGGEWRLLDATGWPDNPTYRNLVASCWSDDDRRHLVVVNLSDQPAQARIPLPWDDLTSRTWQLRDLLDGPSYLRGGAEMVNPGLYVELGAWGSRLFAIEV